MLRSDTMRALSLCASVGSTSDRPKQPGARTAFKPEISAVLPMKSAEVAFMAMLEGKTDGKTVLTR